MVTDKDLGKYVIAKTGVGTTQALGELVAYTDRPHALINLPDGSQMWWHAEMMNVLDSPEDYKDMLDQAMHTISTRRSKW